MLKTIIKINNKEFDIKDFKGIKNEIFKESKSDKELLEFINNLKDKGEFLNVSFLKYDKYEFNLVEQSGNEYDFKG